MTGGWSLNDRSGGDGPDGSGPNRRVRAMLVETRFSETKASFLAQSFTELQVHSHTVQSGVRSTIQYTSFKSLKIQKLHFMSFLCPPRNVLGSNQKQANVHSLLKSKGSAARCWAGDILTSMAPCLSSEIYMSCDVRYPRDQVR